MLARLLRESKEREKQDGSRENGPPRAFRHKKHSSIGPPYGRGELANAGIVEVGILPADPRIHGFDVSVKIQTVEGEGEGDKYLDTGHRYQAHVSTMVGTLVRALYFFESLRAFPK